MPSSPGDTHCAAVSASTWVEPHGKCTVAFAVAWSSPKINFLMGKSYHRTAKENRPVTFAIAACETQNINVTVLLCFGLSKGSSITAKDVGKKVQLPKDGHFDRENFDGGPSMSSSPGDTHYAAVSASTWVEPQGKCTVAFAVAWSSCKIKFLKGKSYHRRYTKFYGTSERAALDLAHDALTSTI